MKLKKVLTIMLACMVALSSLVSFVGCSNEITEEMGNAAVSFVTTTSKALNQSGDVQDGISEKVGDYYWKYYCSKTAPGSDTDVWSVFSDKNKALGLGTITNLLKGESYYFGLRGYSDSNYDTLVWEGFHVDSEGNNAVVKLTSKNQLITVDVYTAGKGRLFFNFVAPAVNGFDASDSYKVSGNVQYDYFTYKITSIDGNTIVTSDTNLAINDQDEIDGIYFDKDESMFYYANSTGLNLDAGTYLFTIWQNSYDLDSAAYKAVNQRKQVLIINIVSGVDTVVKGSLDSTALDTIDYEAYGYTESEKLHMQVKFNKPDTDEDVAPFAVTVTNASNEKKVIYNNDRIKVADGDYVKISWTTDTSMQLYVNGDLLVKTSTRTNDDFTTSTSIEFYERENLNSTDDWRNKTYVTNFDGTSVKAYGKAGLDYIITVQWSDGSNTDNDESISFTIVGIDDSDGITVTRDTAITEQEISKMTTDTSITLTVVTGQNIEAEASVMKSIAQEILDETISSGNKSSDTTDNEVDITLTILETDKTETSTTYDISMDAAARVYNNSKLVYSNSKEIKTVDSGYVTATMQIEKNLMSVHVQHSGYEMNSDWTAEDVNMGTEDNPLWVGYYSYDFTTGELKIKTKSFSPFKIFHDNYLENDYVIYKDGDSFNVEKYVKGSWAHGQTIVAGTLTVEPNASDVLTGYAIYENGSLFGVEKYVDGSWDNGQTIIGGTFTSTPNTDDVKDGYDINGPVSNVYTVTECTHVCKIGNVHYDSLDDAITAAGTTKTTIVILNNFTDSFEASKLSYSTSGSGDSARMYSIRYTDYIIPENADITLDLNGHTYTMWSKENAAEDICSIGSNVELLWNNASSSAKTSIKTYGIKISSGAKLTIDDSSALLSGKLYSTNTGYRYDYLINPQSGSTFVMKNGTVEIVGAYACYFENATTESHFEMLGGKLIGGYYGFYSAGPKITELVATMSDGTISGTGGLNHGSNGGQNAVSVALYGVKTFNMTGGTIGGIYEDDCSYCSGLIIQHGTADVSGGNIISYYDDSDENNDKAYCVETFGGTDAVIKLSDTVKLSGNGSQGNVSRGTINVYGGTVCDTTNSGWYAWKVSPSATGLNIEGGTFKNTNDGEKFIYSYGEEVNATISGGSFYSNSDNITGYLASGKTLQYNNETGLYDVVDIN